MAFLFNVNKKGTILFHPEVMQLCPEFGVLDDDEKLCLILVSDYHSPYNQLPESDRKHKAALQVYGKTNTALFDKTKMKNAMGLYKSLQYNAKRELINVYNDKIKQLSIDLEKATSPLAIKNILDSQKVMRKALEEMNNDLMDEQEKKIELRGKGSLSLMEELVSNKSEYERVTKKK